MKINISLNYNPTQNRFILFQTVSYTSIDRTTSIFPETVRIDAFGIKIKISNGLMNWYYS